MYGTTILIGTLLNVLFCMRIIQIMKYFFFFFERVLEVERLVSVLGYLTKLTHL